MVIRSCVSGAAALSDKAYYYLGRSSGEVLPEPTSGYSCNISLMPGGNYDRRQLDR
jgi:hypothetical protein